MAHHTVDTSRAAEQPKVAGIPVTRENTRHPNLRDMPNARGNAKAGDPVPQRNAQQKERVVGVDRSATRHEAIPEMPIPVSSQFIEPPAKVKASQDLPDHPA